MSIEVNGSRRVAASETLRFTDTTTAFFLRSNGTGTPSLANEGLIEVIGANGRIVPVEYYGVYADYYLQEGASFTNEAGGVLRVHAEAQEGVDPDHELEFQGAHAYGVYSGGLYGLDVFNHGLIEVSADLTATGIKTFDSSLIVNTGVIRVTSDIAYGVISVTTGTLRNEGLIEVNGLGYAFGVHWHGGNTFHNTGSIIARSNYAFGEYAIGLFLDDGANIVNEGLIQGDFAIQVRTDIFELRPKRETIDNRGELVGLVDLGFADDRLVNSGTIRGLVDLGNDDDVYEGAGGRQIGGVFGHFGDDALSGGDHADELFGEDGADEIQGGAGSDFIDGGRDGDQLDGGAGWDTLSYISEFGAVSVDLQIGQARAAGIDAISGFERVLGSRHADTIKGSLAAETLEGGRGDDDLQGRGGDDILFGGHGNDLLSGGAGADTFQFAVGHGRDVVVDFDAQDRIQVWGYTSYQSLSQVGADVVIQFSNQDRITLKNLTLANFNPAAISYLDKALGLTPEGPAALGLQIVNTGALRTYEGEALRFESDNGAYFVVEDKITFDNLGRFEYSTGGEGSRIFDQRYTLQSTITNHQSGVFWAEDTTNSGSYFDSLFLIGGRFDFINHGSVLVRGTAAGCYSTYGLWGSDDGVFENTGSIVVEGKVSASAVNLHAGGTFLNTGLIRVTSEGQISELGYLSASAVSVQGFDLSFRNEGEIIADVLSGPARSTGVTFSCANNWELINTGLIQADVALFEGGMYASNQAETVDTIRNSGELRGAVSTGIGREELYNTGLITGNVSLSFGNDLFDGRSGTQLGSISGNDGDDVLRGGSGAEQLLGGEGADTLEGGAGDDLLDGGEGADRMDGGAGVDHVTYADYLVPVIARLDGGTNTGGAAQGDVLLNIENLTGTRLNDALIGSAEANVLRGLVGVDWLDGRGGADILDGGADIDRVAYANSSTGVTARLDGGANAGGDAEGDVFISIEQLSGSAFDDTLIGSVGADMLLGANGNDRLRGDGGDDTLDGGVGDDILEGGYGRNSLNGGAGQDVAVYAGRMQDYVITYQGDAARIVGKGIDDVLRDVELMQFSDGSVEFGLIICLPGSGAPQAKPGSPSVLPPLEVKPDPLVLPSGFEDKASTDEEPVVCSPGDGTMPSARPAWDLAEVGMLDFDGRDPHRGLAMVDWLI